MGTYDLLLVLYCNYVSILHRSENQQLLLLIKIGHVTFGGNLSHTHNGLE